MRHSDYHKIEWQCHEMEVRSSKNAFLQTCLVTIFLLELSELEKEQE